MAVIYCNRCKLGVHYIDVCKGGANGYPKKSAKQIRREYAFMALTTFLMISSLAAFVFWIVSL